MTVAPNVALGSTPMGSVFFRDSYFALDHRHGRLRLDGALGKAAALLETVLPAISQAELTRAAFLDIESGPRSEESGSFAFVVGVGRFEPYYFHLRQLFHREGSSVEGLLTALGELLEDARCVVTFNGATYDLPHLAAVFGAAGLENPFERLPHLDLLHSARRVYGGGMKSRRLREIETQLLGVERAPRPGAPSYDLHPIFEHNAADVLSLVVLIAHLNRRARELSKTDARYLLMVGRLHEQRGDAASACDRLRRAWQLDPQGLVGGEAVARLARLLGARGDWHEAEALWQDELRVTERLERQVHARAALSKIYERRLRDPQRALDMASEAVRLIEASSAQSRFARSHADLSARVARLAARLLRHAGKTVRSRAKATGPKPELGSRRLTAEKTLR